MKKNVIVIKEDVEIAPKVYLSKGDTLVETSKGRWTIFEEDDEDDDEDDEEDDKVEESEEDEDEGDDEDEKKESAADKAKMAKVRAAQKKK
jgi:hypothetical protein